jgi:hypothetical protein
VRQSVGNLRGSSLWECVCDCGATVVKSSNMLRTGHCKSCGCLNLDSARATHTKHGMIASPEYIAWKDMKRRCLNPNTPNYKRYGGRGITVCSRWLQSFRSFYADMGKRPSTLHSLERIDNSGNYDPWNCKWATRLEQARNTRRNHWLEIDGRRQTMSEWAREIGKPREWVRYRLRRGMLPREAVFGIEETLKAGIK